MFLLRHKVFKKKSSFSATKISNEMMSMASKMSVASNPLQTVASDACPLTSLCPAHKLPIVQSSKNNNTRIVVTSGAPLTEEFVQNFLLHSLDVVAASGVEYTPGVRFTLFRSKKQVRCLRFSSAMAEALQAFNARHETKMVLDRCRAFERPARDLAVLLIAQKIRRFC